MNYAPTFICLLILCLFLVGRIEMWANGADLSEATWIWADADGDGFALTDNVGTDTAYLRKTFVVKDTSLVKSATLTATGDNAVQVWLNGQEVDRTYNWTVPIVEDVKKLLVNGDNVVCLMGTNSLLPKDPAGVAAKLVIENIDGEQFAVVSDSSWSGGYVYYDNWTSPEFDDSTWATSVSLVPVGGAPWGFSFPGAGSGWTHMPSFAVNDKETTLSPLHDFLIEHYRPGIFCTLWDPWLPRSLLWVGTTPRLTKDLRAFYASALLDRKLMPDGYVEMRQHRGLGLPEGWPFPLWTQGPGVGWHFSVAGVPYGPVNGINRATNTNGWTIDGATVAGLDDFYGLRLILDEAKASIMTPEIRAAKIVSPYVRLEWRSNSIGEFAQPYIEWTTERDVEFSADRRLYFNPPSSDGELTFTVLPLYQIPDWSGDITRMRINFDNAPGASVDFAALFTAVDSRKPITNPDFIIGSVDYFRWTGDKNFLRLQINRLRMAMQYILDEFNVLETGLAYVSWPGHEGRSGVIWKNDEKLLRPGEGIGNNYFDLLPFGGWDCYLNIRIYTALLALAQMEEAIESHPQWNTPSYPAAHNSAALYDIASQLKKAFEDKFWNEQTGRFVSAIDADGKVYDYGFTPVNLEAIVYGLASDYQAELIFEWLDGHRVVNTDTSKGQDIYNWRFAPRVTTRRNIDYYAYVWSAPESIAFGDQIQDGGAVLGFSYYDLMARIKVLGPDDAWSRFSEILKWYREVMDYGGPRVYYQFHEGTLQGGGTAGGLGIDHEFVETVMLPSVILYGFIGIEATPTGLYANPRLPSDWYRLSMTDISYGQWRFNLSVDMSERVVNVRITGGDPELFKLDLPSGWGLDVTY